MTAHHSTWKRRGRRRKGILWEYNRDGVSARERIKGVWKRYWRRWTRRFSGREELAQ